MVFLFPPRYSFGVLRLATLVLLLTAFLPSGYAQLSMGGQPQPIQGEQAGQAEALRRHFLAAPSTPEIPFSNLFRVAYLPTEQYNLSNLQPEQWGEWYQGENGMHIWRGQLIAPYGDGLSLYFDHFCLSEDDKLYLSTLDGSRSLGAFTKQNNSVYNDLTTGYLAGTGIIVQFETTERPAQLPWHLKQATLLLQTEASRRAAGYPSTRNWEPWFSLDGLECAPNSIIYSPRWGKEMRSALLMVIRGRAVCSGTLINNSKKDGKAYVLTAAHCMNGNYRYEGDKAYIDETARQTLFYFNFFSPTGKQFTRGIEEQSLCGARVVAMDEKCDLCLLEITGVLPNVSADSCAIPRSYMPYFSGWNHSDTPQGDFVGLHHPKASVLRYNRCSEPIKKGDFNVSFVHWKGSHWHVPTWEIGTTAGGSSGSALFDSEGHIIGALSGGSSFCDTPHNDFYYGLFSCWKNKDKKAEEQLAPYLDPINTGRVSLEGFEPFGPTAPVRLSHILHHRERDRVETAPIEELRLQGVGSSFPILTESKLEGVVAVVDEQIEWPNCQLIVMRSNASQSKEELFRQPINHPGYSFPLDGDMLSRPRWLTDRMQFFVPLALHNIVLSKGDTLHIAISSRDPKQPLSLPLLRSTYNAAMPHAAIHQHAGVESGWVSSLHETGSTATLFFPGAYWIDAIISPTGKDIDSIGLAPGNHLSPRFLYDNRELTLILPDSFTFQKDHYYLQLVDEYGNVVLRRPVCEQRTTINLYHHNLSPGLYIAVLYDRKALNRPMGHFKLHKK